MDYLFDKIHPSIDLCPATVNRIHGHLRDTLQSIRLDVEGGAKVIKAGNLLDWRETEEDLSMGGKHHTLLSTVKDRSCLTLSISFDSSPLRCM